MLCKANDKKDIFPMWGTCLGFELLNVLASGLKPEELLVSCDSENYSIPLEITGGNTIIIKTIVRDWSKSIGGWG